MKVVEINSGYHGSTGKIMLSIAEEIGNSGGEAYTFSEVKSSTAPMGHRYFGSRIENLFHRGVSVMTGISGKGSVIGTRGLLKQLDTIKPDILHLHNLHGWYINLPMLFDYIKKNNIITVWTLHDCWGFTAQCSHFTMEKCEKWKTGCYDCPRYRLYPYTFVDKTDKMWQLKKEWFTGVKDMTVVTPSEWLADLVRRSFLGEYDVKVINNGIDLGIFKPTASDLRDKYHLQDKKILLGVASAWNDRKGLDVFIELSKKLDDNCRVVLVGTDDEIEKKLPSSVISIQRTYDQTELAKIYTAADVFVNPTREENFPTVNIEALACGTPVVTFKTGGSPEMIDEKTGIVVEYGNISELKVAVLSVLNNDKIERDACLQRSKLFDAASKYREYVELYNDLLQRSLRK